MNHTLKTNILNLQFQKYLVIASTSIIIGFTYFIALFISIISKQISFQETTSILIVIVLSTGIIGLSIISFLNSISHLNKIINILKNL